MDRLYQETNSLLHDVHTHLVHLERAADESAAQKILQNVHAAMGEIDKNSERLDILVNKEPPARRPTSRVKVDQLKADAQRVNVASSALYARLVTKWRAASDREELLKQRFRPNDSTAVSFEDQEHMMNDRLHSTNRQVDDLIAHGAAVLDNLRHQHMSLRGVRRKMMDIGAALGLSSTTLNMIDRRVREDWFIFLVGCIVTLVFMYTFYRFWKG